MVSFVALLVSIHAAAPLLAPAPPADSFSASVDRAAARALGERKSCHARDGLDLSGDAAFVWGSNFHLDSAATCCAACAAHRANCGNGSGGKVFWDDGKAKLRCRGKGRCNAWVFCAAEAGQCFSYDIHVHKRGECWLKHEPNISVPVAAGAFQSAPLNPMQPCLVHGGLPCRSARSRLLCFSALFISRADPKRSTGSTRSLSQDQRCRKRWSTRREISGRGASPRRCGRQRSRPRGYRGNRASSLPRALPRGRPCACPGGKWPSARSTGHADCRVNAC